MCAVEADERPATMYSGKPTQTEPSVYVLNQLKRRQMV